MSQKERDKELRELAAKLVKNAKSLQRTREDVRKLEDEREALITELGKHLVTNL